MKLGQHVVVIYKFNEERVLHQVYTAFKVLDAKMIVDPKNLLLKVDALVIASKEDAVKLANSTLSDDDQNAFQVKEIA